MTSFFFFYIPGMSHVIHHVTVMIWISWCWFTKNVLLCYWYKILICQMKKQLESNNAAAVSVLFIRDWFDCVTAHCIFICGILLEPRVLIEGWTTSKQQAGSGQPSHNSWCLSWTFWDAGCHWFFLILFLHDSVLSELISKHQDRRLRVNRVFLLK